MSWRYLTIDELLKQKEPIWLHILRWDHNLMIPTAIEEVYQDDEGNPYSIKFYSGNVQIVKGYGVYWWVTNKKPPQNVLLKWEVKGCRNKEAEPLIKGSMTSSTTKTT